MGDRDSGPARIGDLLATMGDRFRSGGPPMQIAKVWSLWGQVVGDAVAANAEPSSLREGVLRVRTGSPTWATEVAYLAPEIRHRLNQAVGQELIKEVRVWTGPGRIAPPDAPRRNAVTEARPRPATVPSLHPLEALDRVVRAWRAGPGRGRS